MRSKKRILTFFILLTIVATVGLLGACIDFNKPVNKVNLAFDSEVVLESSIFVYTGEEVKPSVKVTHRDEIVDAQNYTLTYSNNVDVGKATVTAEGKGNYYGSVSANFDIGYQYLFDVNGADKVDGEVSQIVVSKDKVVPPIVEKKGYEFSHWSLDSQVVDFSDSDNIPTSGEFVANFELKSFTVTYHLDGGTNHADNKSQYTVEDRFELKNAILRGMRFAGWYTDSEHKNRITSLDDYAQDLQLYARFVDYTAKTIEYRVPGDATAVPIDYLYPETPLDTPIAQVKEIDGTQQKLVWYADDEYKVRYYFREMPDEDIVLYAQWEEVVRAGFLDKVQEFSSNNVSIDSFEELVAYIDYVCFNNIVSRVNGNEPIDVNYVKITYVTDRASIKKEIDDALVAVTFPRMAPISYAYREGEFKIALTNDVTGKEASVSLTDESDFTVQLGNIFALGYDSREDGYEKFPIDFVENTYEVETSNQLFYVVSHGYRPLPKKDSRAEDVYQQFRNIMRKICNDSMSDLEKSRAIYEWIVLNVQYDNAVAYPEEGSDAADKEKTYLFDAFYLEGVLRGSAVCDGISKAYSLMCAIEGIDCVRVTGESQDGGHAWNKVKLSGTWYLSDATWGNAYTSNGQSRREFLSYQYFLFTDETRINDGYVNQNYTYYQAVTDYSDKDYCSSSVMRINGHSFDFYIDSDDELSYLLDYIDTHFDASKLAGFSFEIMINKNVTIDNQPLDEITSTDVGRLYSSAMRILEIRRRNSLLNRPQIGIDGYLPYDEYEYGYSKAIYMFKASN